MNIMNSMCTKEKKQRMECSVNIINMYVVCCLIYFRQFKLWKIMFFFDADYLKWNLSKRLLFSIKKGKRTVKIWTFSWWACWKRDDYHETKRRRLPSVLSSVSSVRHEAPHQPLSHPRSLPRTSQGKFIKSKLEENIRNILSHSICALNSKYIEMLQ